MTPLRLTKAILSKDLEVSIRLRESLSVLKHLVYAYEGWLVGVDLSPAF